MAETIITSSVLIIALALLRRAWRGKLSPILQYALWLLAAVRLLLPLAVFENGFYIMNMVYRVTEDRVQWNLTQKSDMEAIFTIPAAEGNEAAAKSDSAAAAVSADSVRQDTTGANIRAAEAREVASEEQIHTGGQEIVRRRLSVQSMLRYLWYGGMVLTGGWFLICNGLFYHKLRRERSFLTKRGKIRIYEADNLDSPCLWGILHPAVYLTPDALASDQYREHAIAHELTHYRHGDHIWVLVRNLCTVIYWFDPLVWMASALAARDCELACDAGTVRRLGLSQREAYGATLIELACAPSGRRRVLRCSTDFSGGRKELRERITVIASWKKRRGIMAALAVICAFLLAACTFGSTKGERAAGGYAESGVELPVSTVFSDFVQEKEILRLVDAGGRDYISRDGGSRFTQAPDIPAAVGTNRLYVTGGPGGSRIFIGFIPQRIWQLVTVEGRLVELEKQSGTEDFYPADFCYGGGYFYTLSENTIYRTDPATGETAVVLESTGYPLCISADESFLYIVTRDGMILYDPEKGSAAERQDEVLAAFVGGREDILLYPWENGVLYIAAHEGIYRHELYTDTVERLVDGEMCTMSDRDRNLVGMAVIDTGAEESFLVYYSDGKLMRYDYDENLIPPQDPLRIYSAYEDCNIRRAVTAFREKYPDIPVKYEVGVNPSYGVTLEDALKNLSTELAAGTGPDILVMDDIPYTAYVQKGVLADLSELREKMSGEDYFVSIIDAMGTEDGLYRIPLAFAVPVLAGDAAAIENVGSLAELGDLLEAAGAEGGSVIGCVNAKEVLSLLAQSSMGAWVSAEGTLDREALTEFMTQAKRIYDIQMRGVPEELRGRVVGYHNEGGSVLKRRFGEYEGGDVQVALRNKFSLFPEQPYCAGYVGERFALFYGELAIGGESWCPMPGQKLGACIPVSMAAVNSASDAKEESLLFLEYALSEEFQAGASLKGLPVNRRAYMEKQVFPGVKGWENEPYTTTEVTGKDGTVTEYDIYWPDEAAFGKLDSMVEGIREVNLCESKVYEEVIRQGEKVLAGELTIEEGVDALERALQIYLAE
ncbi:MAG: extracellular solute-binding protein [Lachnospiraceae bacterium]|nr:extracellular solute-binding protein [Lachnospiraceae bacterium]